MHLFSFDPVSYLKKPMLYKSFGLKKKKKMKNVRSLDGFSHLNTCGVSHLTTQFSVVLLGGEPKLQSCFKYCYNVS